MHSEESVPNERLRRARNLKGWSQAELAEKVGTSFEMVSRWERGITVPSPHYRKRVCTVLGQTAEDLGLVRDLKNPFTPPSSPFVLLAASHADAEKAIVSHLKTALEERGITLWSSRQLGKPRNGNAQATLHEVVHGATAILVILSPESRTSRHVREALEMASIYQRPVCGVWIEGEHWQEYLPKDEVKLAALIDTRTSDGPVMIGEIATALERVGLISHESGKSASVDPEGHLRVGELSTSSKELQSVEPTSGRTLERSAGARRLPADVPLLPPSPRQRQRRAFSPSTAGLFIGLAVLVLAGGVLASTSLLAHFGVFGTRNGPTTPARGGIWTQDAGGDPVSLIPNGYYNGEPSAMMDQALYLPLFYGDAQAVIHSGAASEVPSIQNGGVSPDATTWTFHLRPHQVWSDGQPYDARDVDFTWQLWRNPKFGAVSTLGLDLISSATVSADRLAITFHLKRPFAPFLAALWVDGVLAPLPAHHFSSIAPEAILKSPENLNPKVTSGPFMMRESLPGDHYTLVRNPRYYRASEGLPYLDKVVFSVTPSWEVLHKDLETGFFDAAGLTFDITNLHMFQRLKDYTIITPPTNNAFEALYFNFHNMVLASHQEVRQAMAMAVDQQALINGPLHGFGTPLCTDHPLAYHPGFEPNAPCPVFDLAVANKLLDDNGWVQGPDGVRARGGQRLEFEYSTQLQTILYRIGIESIIQRDFRQIGIQLDIQNYPADTFFGSVLPQGKASPPTGAVAGRYDIAEFVTNLSYDPDDSILFACNQVPPVGFNFGSYCNPTLDALYAQEQATADPGVRQQIFIQIHLIYLTQFPFIVLYSPSSYALVHKGTHNYLPGPFTDTYNIWEWWCDNGKC